MTTPPNIIPILTVQPDSIPAGLKAERRWVLWNLDKRDQKCTKVPYQTSRPSQKAHVTNPETWGDFTTTLTAYQDGKADGIGFVLGDGFFGFDADRCRDPQTGVIEPEVLELVARLNTYTEVSPRGAGVKAIGRGQKPGDRCRIGKFELYVSARFFCITGHHVAGTPTTIEERSAQLTELYVELFPPKANSNGDAPQSLPKPVELDDAALIEKAKTAKNGAAFAALWRGDTSKYGGDDSAADLALCSQLAFWTNNDADRIDRLFRQSGLMRPKWNELRGSGTYGEMTLAKAIAGCHENYSTQIIVEPATPLGVTLEDFYAYMPMHEYIFAPSGEVWPASSVNARVRPVQVIDEAGEAKTIKANAWLDQHRAVEQMTWSPGSPTLIRDRLVSDGGWIHRRGCDCFNHYRPPRIQPGNPRHANRWLDHVARVYPHDCKHIVAFLAHRVQRPHEKINHALVLGGAQGVGKDTILEPVKTAIGPWNFAEVSPAHLLGRFNGFLKSVILRVSEARDLGDMDRYSFYDHMKVYSATPPDVLRVDEKNLREYVVWNVCGVIITTNHRTDGLYLPADDRRHYVAWSDLTIDEFPADYWTNMYEWYTSEGNRHVATYLAQYDLSNFDPKAPPPKTAAFWDMVDANRAPEDAELADSLDELDNPSAVTLGDITSRAAGSFPEWLRDRKNARQIPHRMETAGYIGVRNPDAKDGLWRVAKRRQVIYVRRGLSVPDRLVAARNLQRE